MIIRFCLSVTAKLSNILRTSTQYQHFTTSKWTYPKRLKKDHTNTARFSKKVNDNLIKTTSRYNGADRFVTLLFDEMKIKENLILVEHRELHWFYWFREHCHKYLELWKERRFRNTCIGVFCQGRFFKFKVQFKGVFRTQSNIYDGAFCENSSRLLAVNYFCKRAPS